MDALSLELYPDSPAEAHPLLMEQPGNSNTTQHVINITVRSDNSTTTSPYDRHITGTDTVQHQDGSSSQITHFAQPSTYNVSNGSNPRNSSFVRRGHRSPLNSGIWISVELVLIISQIVVSIVVLSFSKHEHPHTPLHTWIFGYAAGCVATLPLLYWRCYHNQIQEQDSSQAHQTSPSGPVSLSVSRTNAGEDYRGTAGSSRGNQGSGLMNRSNVRRLMKYFKLALDCFFAVWFVVGNVWIFSGQSSADDAPNLYRLCIVFLTFSCIGYAMPFILCATICCCLPCIISIIGFREDEILTRGATTESINALPTYKFKMEKNKNGDESNSAGEGGIVAAGTKKERVISEEDAVCCICLANYENNDDLRELPCSHFFHKDCVDKWLKINALCPLCKSGAGETATVSELGEDARPQRVENSIHNDGASAHP